MELLKVNKPVDSFDLVARSSIQFNGTTTKSGINFSNPNKEMAKKGKQGDKGRMDKGGERIGRRKLKPTFAPHRPGEASHPT